MNDNALTTDKAFIGKIDNAISSIQELQGALKVLRMASDLNKSFLLIDLQAATRVVRVR